MPALPFSPAATLVLLLICLVAAFVCVGLLGRRKLTMGYTLVWLVVIGGLALLISVPHLVNVLSRVLASGTPDGVLRLLAFTTIVGFLLFFSVKVSELTNRIDDLVQRLALFDHEQRKQLREHTNPSEPRKSDREEA
jgi:hypothetical protein